MRWCRIGSALRILGARRCGTWCLWVEAERPRRCPSLLALANSFAYRSAANNSQPLLFVNTHAILRLMPRSETLGVRVEPAVKATLRRAAAKAGRTLAGHLAVLLTAAARRFEGRETKRK